MLWSSKSPEATSGPINLKQHGIYFISIFRLENFTFHPKSTRSKNENSVRITTLEFRRENFRLHTLVFARISHDSRRQFKNNLWNHFGTKIAANQSEHGGQIGAGKRLKYEYERQIHSMSLCTRQRVTVPNDYERINDVWMQRHREKTITHHTPRRRKSAAQLTSVEKNTNNTRYLLFSFIGNNTPFLCLIHIITWIDVLLCICWCEHDASAHSSTSLC